MVIAAHPLLFAEGIRPAKLCAILPVPLHAALGGIVAWHSRQFNRSHGLTSPPAAP
ncbi:MAG TPA: hypothetical protein VI168_01575 [Croceibacterium sp.]